MSTALPSRLERQLKGDCCYGACKGKALDGSDYCAPHDAHERGRAAAKQKRRRLRRAREGVCIDGCGRKVGKRSARGRIVQRRCRQCAKEDREARNARVPGESARVPVNAPRTKLEVHPDGYTRIRTIGRGVRGQKSREELDDDLRKDVRDAIANAQAVHDSGIAALRTPAVVDLGRVARREALAVVADRLLAAARTFQAVADALCPGRSQEMASVIAEARDD